MVVGDPDSDRIIIFKGGTSSRSFRAAAFVFCNHKLAYSYLLSVSRVVMPFAVVVAAGVAVNDGAVEEHRHDLLHRKLRSASVDADA